MSVVFYSGERCPVCKTMLPVVQSLVPDVKVIKLDGDSPEVEKYGIRTVPVIMVFDPDGNEVGRVTGGMSKMQLQLFFNEKMK